ncbi:hypothetical protein [Escherichia phage dw-ec]|nr:hypothetical protein [Escherichia phage dw-ec]
MNVDKKVVGVFVTCLSLLILRRLLGCLT